MAKLNRGAKAKAASAPRFHFSRVIRAGAEIGADGDAIDVLREDIFVGVDDEGETAALCVTCVGAVGAGALNSADEELCLTVVLNESSVCFCVVTVGAVLLGPSNRTLLGAAEEEATCNEEELGWLVKLPLRNEDERGIG